MTKQNGPTTRAEVSRAKMIDAAMELISEGGLGHATLARVGERAGYSRGLADYHFGSKPELVEQVVAVIAERWVADIEARGISRMRGIQALYAVIEAYMLRLENDPRTNHVLLIMAGESAADMPDIKSRVARHDESFRRRIRRWVVEAKDDGAFRQDVDPVRASILIEGLLRGVGAQYLLSPEAFDPSDMTELVADAVIGSLSSPSGLVASLSAPRAVADDPAEVVDG